MSRPTSEAADRFFDRMTERGMPLTRAKHLGDYDVVILPKYDGWVRLSQQQLGGVELLLARHAHARPIYLQVDHIGYYLGPPPSAAPMLGHCSSPEELADDLFNGLELFFAMGLAESIG